MPPIGFTFDKDVIYLQLHTVSAAYFSATGTTRCIVKTIAQDLAHTLSLPLQEFDFSLPSARQVPLSFSPHDLVLLGTPVYAGRVPNLLLPYIASCRGMGALAVPIVLYGNRAFDDALMELRNTLEEGGFHTIGAAAFVGEHSFGRDLAAGRPDASDLDLAHSFAQGIATKLIASDFEAPPSPISVPGNNPVGPYFRPTDANGAVIDIRKVKPVTSEDCADCKWCAEHCPMGAISYERVSDIPGICIKCNACVKACPTGAKFFTDPAYRFHRDDITARYQDPRKEPVYFL